jgi:fructose-1,6-bisphosphatase/inositol monophosphatase family enzyme/predicted metal-dependent phosphoesterase TrpH
MRADLHVHSLQSDGSYSFEEALARAHKAGLSHISFVDHDDTRGVPEAVALGRRIGLHVIPGVEISAYDFEKKRKVLLLGYSFDLPAKNIERLCTPLREARNANTIRQIEALRKHGLPISLEDVEKVAGDSPVLYKQHIMLHLIKKGLTDSIYSDLYRELFKGEGPAAGDITYVDVFQALEAIQADGGKAVLAHPGQQNTWDLVPALAEKGLWGIELHHEDHGPAERKRVAQLAGEYGLSMTGGSDDHGAYGSHFHIGEFVTKDLPLDGGPSTFLLDKAKSWVREAGEYLRRAAMKLPAVQEKGGAHWDLVTEHDLHVHHFFEEKIRTLGSGHYLLSEEDETPFHHDRLWVLDPIDGTTNFVQLRRNFTIALSYILDGQEEFGLVYDVMADRLYWGLRGRGAWCNYQPLALDGQGTPEKGLIDLSHGSLRRLEEEQDFSVRKTLPGFLGHRASGCASLAICRVAAGELGVYASSKVNLWDFSAAKLILQEAGGACYESADLMDEKRCRAVIHFAAADTEQTLSFYLSQSDCKEGVNYS